MRSYYEVDLNKVTFCHLWQEQQENKLVLNSKIVMLVVKKVQPYDKNNIAL